MNSTSYCYYQNYPHRRIMIHDEKCSFCRQGSQKNQTNGIWSRRFETYQSARENAQSIIGYTVRNCQWCLRAMSNSDSRNNAF